MHEPIFYVDEFHSWERQIPEPEQELPTLVEEWIDEFLDVDLTDFQRHWISAVYRRRHPGPSRRGPRPLSIDGDAYHRRQRARARRRRRH